MHPRELSLADLQNLPPDTYTLVDIRSDHAYQNGFIPGTIHIPLETLEQEADALPRDREIILYCTKGQVSADIAERLAAQGLPACHLTGGYVAWLLEHLSYQDKWEAVETSIRKKFHKTLFSQFTKGIRTYDLIQAGDRIAVCISGGKDSMLMAKLFQELTRHRKVPFELIFLVMDPGYAPENRALIEHNAKILNIPLTIFETDIFDSVFTAPKSACYLCARMRRGHLYSKAQELGCNKIALGHHYDDVIETILMSVLHGAQFQTMMPKLHSQNFPGMELIRPMYFIREKDIKHFQTYHDLRFLLCACRFTDTCSSDGGMVSKRTEIKQLIRTLKETNPYVESNIFNSVENVHIEAIVSYKKDGRVYHFLDRYDEV